MKKLFLFSIGFALLTLPSCNEEKAGDEKAGETSGKVEKKDDSISEAEVPAAVVAAFKAKYADATGVEWETAKENDQPTFKAKWKTGEVKMKAEFSQDGQFIKEEKD